MPQFFSMEFDFGRPSCHPPANQAMSSPVVHLGFVIDPSAGVATLGLLWAWPFSEGSKLGNRKAWRNNRVVLLSMGYSGM